MKVFVKLHKGKNSDEFIKWDQADGEKACEEGKVNIVKGYGENQR